MKTDRNTDDSNPDDQINSVEKTIDMDDTTGSNGGSTDERFIGESSNTDALGYTSQPTHSRSDSGRVDDEETANGTGSSNTAQSGGRSQY